MDDQFNESQASSNPPLPIEQQPNANLPQNNQPCINNMPPVYYINEAKSSRTKYWFFGCSSGCLISMLLPICFIFFFSYLISGSCSENNNLNSSIIDNQYEFNRIAINANSKNADVYIARIKLNGPIMLSTEDTSLFEADYSSANYALHQIKKAKADPLCSGIILDLSTPGGGVTDSDIIWKALQDFKKSKEQRKVVVLMGDTVASGGYYISTAADYIFAHPTTMTGSIGVIISSINATELAQKLGITSVTIKSGKTKDFLNPLRPLTPEEEAMLQAMVDKLNSRFIQLIVEGRGLEEAKVRAIADGRVMLADEALNHGLIDQIGYFDDVVNWFCNNVHKDKKVCIYQYSTDDGFLTLFQSPTFIGKCAAEAAEEYSKKLTTEGSSITPAYK